MHEPLTRSATACWTVENDVPLGNCNILSLLGQIVSCSEDISCACESDPVNGGMLEHTHCTIGFGCQEEVEMMDWDQMDRANDGSSCVSLSHGLNVHIHLCISLG